jgi:hypothetical protein
MLVRMQNTGHSITGIRVRTSDARRHFPTNVKAIDLELDHLRIRCDLKESFWLNRPQISDPRLRLWLETKALWNDLSRVLRMRKDGDSYRLEFTNRPPRAHLKPILIASQGSDED